MASPALPPLRRSLTFGQFANVFMIFGVLLIAAMMVPETQQNLLNGRIAYSIWVSLVLATPALCLYILALRSSAAQGYADLFYTFGYLAYLVHFYYTVFAHFGGFAGMWKNFPHPIALSNLALTVLWAADVVLIWANPKPAGWLTAFRWIVRFFVFLSFFLSSIVFLPGQVTILGVVMTACLAISLIIRIVRSRAASSTIPASAH